MSSKSRQLNLLSDRRVVLSNGIYERIIPHKEATNSYRDHFIPFFKDINQHILRIKKGEI